MTKSDPSASYPCSKVWAKTGNVSDAIYPRPNKGERFEGFKMGRSFSYRQAGKFSVAMVLLLAGCSEPFDYDLRGNVGGFNTSEAARGATTQRAPAS